MAFSVCLGGTADFQAFQSLSHQCLTLITHYWLVHTVEPLQRASRLRNDWSALSDVYAGAAAMLPERLCQRGPGLALYGVEQRKWPWLLRGWLAALQPSKSTSTNCTYMAWPKNEITTVFSSEVF